MVVSVFASSSSGNCALISEGETHLLIDAGISARRIVAALRSLGLGTDQIKGVLITHEHSDHISGLETLVKRCSAPIFAPRTVAFHLRNRYPLLEDRIRVIPVGEAFEIGALQLRAFHTSHDTDESVGYRIEGGGIYAQATDTGCVTAEILEALRGADTVLLESNHDELMLRYGPYPIGLKRRILSAHGHLSNAACAETALLLSDAGTRLLVLGHLSRENNTPEKALEQMRSALAGKALRFCCAPEFGCLRFDVERGEVLAC